MHDRRILLVGTFLSAARHVHSVGEELRARLIQAGWRVTAASSRTGRVLRVIDIVTTAWRRRDAYDVAHVDVFSGPAFAWAEAVCWTLRRARKPYVLSLHGGNLPDFAVGRGARVRRLLSSAKAVVVPSRYLLEQMAAYHGGLRLLDNPLDLGRYSFRNRAVASPRLVWLRAFDSIYNPGLAPAVVVRLRDEFPEIGLHMIGPDKDGNLKRVQDVANSLGLAEHVTFVGGVPNREVPHWFNVGDIFLNTTDIDNTPVSVLEAMASGLCIVSTNVGGIPYLLEHERDALLVPPRDPDAMADAVRRILTEPGLAERLSISARQKAERWDWSKILPQWEAIFTQAMTVRNSLSNGFKTAPFSMSCDAPVERID